MWISRKKYNKLLRRLVLAEQVADAALERQYEYSKEQRIKREILEVRYGAAKSFRILSGTD